MQRWEDGELVSSAGQSTSRSGILSHSKPASSVLHANWCES